MHPVYFSDRPADLDVFVVKPGLKGFDEFVEDAISFVVGCHADAEADGDVAVIKGFESHPWLVVADGVVMCVLDVGDDFFADLFDVFEVFVVAHTCLE